MDQKKEGNFGEEDEPEEVIIEYNFAFKDQNIIKSEI